MHIVHESVAVVVNTVARDFAAVDPHVGGQVGVVIVHAGINHRHHNVAVAAGGQSLALQVGPRLRHLGGGQMPLLANSGSASPLGMSPARRRR